MQDDFQKILLNFKEQEVPEKLYGAIFSRIESKKILMAKIKLAVFGFSSLFSLVAMFPLFKYLFGEFYQSGFYAYVTLIFSDSYFVLQNWREISLSLAESAPVIGLTMLLTTALILLSSLKAITKNIKTARGRMSFA